MVNQVFLRKKTIGIKLYSTFLFYSVWSGKINDDYDVDFECEFDWDELKSRGVYEITGHIYLKTADNRCRDINFDVKITEDRQDITNEVECGYSFCKAYFGYSLTPHYAPTPEKPDYEKMFAQSDQNDTILVVEGKKLHVSKAFLSYHSEYFRVLFSSNFKEGQMDEIPIGEVSFKDFALLLSTFYPTQAFPTDKNVEKLLEMARRFLVSSATRSAEYHLINNSNIKNEKMLQLADEYGLTNLLEKCIRRLNTEEKAEQMKKSEEFEMLSDSAKAKVLDRISYSSQFY
ncbi:hypothetical protein CRE_06866 [Caenorhabditis remanei]|uniref:BTB domain-containing protein n=1 Tax=Caenorhabditis remanei TaxID=31234 RepID=E3MZN1_CAERE|nr:hypothetical protein CRE_06866 [Caenorhabditis remanei]